MNKDVIARFRYLEIDWGFADRKTVIKIPTIRLISTPNQSNWLYRAFKRNKHYVMTGKGE